jgi:hypothetical protein
VIDVGEEDLGYSGLVGAIFNSAVRHDMIPAVCTKERVVLALGMGMVWL